VGGVEVGKGGGAKSGKVGGAGDGKKGEAEGGTVGGTVGGAEGGKVGGAEGGQIYNCLDCTRLFMSADGYAKHLKVILTFRGPRSNRNGNDVYICSN